MPWPISRLSILTAACILAGMAAAQDRERPTGGAPADAGASPAGEARAARDRLFEQLDRDGDGTVTLDEIPEPLRERAQQLFERLGKQTIVRGDLDRLGDAPQPRRPRSVRGPAIFRALDEDGDGRITREELARAGGKFDELDADGNGALTPDELFGLPGGFVRPELSETRPQETDDPADPANPAEASRSARAQNGNAEGAADAENATNIGNGGNAPVPQGGSLADRLFRRYDRDGDRRLSPQEAPALLREHFGRFDANGDGFIDRDEFERIVAQVRPPQDDTAQQ